MRMIMAIAALSMAGASGGAVAGDAKPARYVFAWAGDEDGKDSDFLAVIDVDPASKTYGQVVATAPTGRKGQGPHHIEYETPPGSTLFANGWPSGQSYVLDIADPLKPRVAATFTRAGVHGYAHSFARLPGGHVLATYQATGDKYAPPGALVELDERGQVVRISPSATRDIPTAINWPYSLAVAPAADRVVTTSTDMGLGPDWKSPETSHVQIWRLRDLKLLHSIALPATPDKQHFFPAEPRLLGDGTMLVNTFTCGLFKIDGLESGRPNARFVHGFPSGPNPHDMCAVPLVVGKYWLQSVGAINGVVVLDVSNPDRPVEVSRLAMPHRFHGPHWMAADRANGRIVMTGMRDSWLAMLKFDERSGTLSIDEGFGTRGGFEFDRASWPHGATGKAIVHGSLFSR